MPTSLALALLLSATASTHEVELPVAELTDAQRLSVPGTARVKISQLTPDQLRTSRERLQRELDQGELSRGSTAGLITAGAVTLIGGALVAGFGLAMSFVPYAGSDGTFGMFLGGTVASIVGGVMFGMGLSRASTRSGHLERIEALDAQLKARSAAREGAPPRGAKQFASVIRFTVAEF